MITCEYCEGYQYCTDGDTKRMCSIERRKVESKDRKCGRFVPHQFFFCKKLGIRLAVELCPHKREMEVECRKCSQYVTINEVLEQFHREKPCRPVATSKEKPSMFSRNKEIGK